MLFSRKTARRAGWASVVLGLMLSVIPILASRASGVANGVIAGGGAGTEIDITVNGRTYKNERAGVIRLTVDGKEYRTFCIDFLRRTAKGNSYVESPWSSTGVAAALPKVIKVVEAYAAGAHNGPRAAAAQALIWKYTNGAVLEPTTSPAVLTAYAELEAAVAGSGSEPPASPTVDIGDGTFTGTAGSTFGPYVITTNQASVTLGSSNPAVTMKVNGVAGTTASNGAALTVEVPAGTPAGSATITATATGTVARGRAFVSPDGHQPLILIDPISRTVTDSITITWTGDQPPVVADPVVDCDAKDVTYSITNPATNTASVTVVVSDPVEGSKTVVLAPGETKQVKVAIGADGVYDITVTHDGKVLSTAKGTDEDCGEVKPPVMAEPVVDCDAKDVTISITNPATNTASVTVVVSDPGAGSQTVALAPGETKQVKVAIGADGKYDIKVTHDGKVIASAKGTDEDCDKPAKLTATHVVVCADQTVTVTVRNEGGQSGTAVVADAAAGFSQSVTVAGNGQVQVVVPVGADEAYDITVTSGATSIARFTGDIDDCPVVTTTTTSPPPPPPPLNPIPQASVANVCDAGGVLLSLRNESVGTAVFTVRNGGVVVASGIGVVKESPQTVVVPVSGDSYNIQVTATPSYEATFAGSRATCATTTTVQVAGTTVVPGPTTTPGGGGDGDPGSTTTATVLGTTVAPTPGVGGGGTLPRTGAASRTASGLGMALLLIGGSLLLLSGLARREQHPIRILE